MDIDAGSIGIIDLVCDSSVDTADLPCNLLTMMSNNAGIVTITANEREAIQSSTFWVQNATLVKINGKGNYSLISSVLRADYASMLEINLASDDPDVSTHLMNWYLPEKVAFNCFGTGCKNLNEIYRYSTRNADGFTFYIDTCGQCNSTSNCLVDFDLECKGGANDFFTQINPCNTFNNCGCRDIISNTSLQFNYYEQKCYNPNILIQCDANEQCIIDCDKEFECKNADINATLATNLTLNCIAPEACSGSTVMCPDGICAVTCNGNFACFEQKINYLGELQDEGGVLLNCTTNFNTLIGPYINGITDCTASTYRHCYHEDAYTSTDTETITTVSVQNTDQNAEVNYDVSFTIQDYDCINPKLTFEYELVK